MLLISDTNQYLKKEHEEVSKAVRKNFNENLAKSDFEVSFKNVLNYYETIAVAANTGLLDKKNHKREF